MDPAPPGAKVARVIVKLKADSLLLREAPIARETPEARRAYVLGRRFGIAGRAGSRLSERTQVVFADGLTSAELARHLSTEPDVEYAVPDRRRRVATAPNDPLYGYGVGGDGPLVGQWYLRAPAGEVRSSIDVESAWSVTTGSPSVVVADLDTGVRFEHPDLLAVVAGGNLLPGYDMIADVATANDGDGRDADASDPGDWLTAIEVGSLSSPFFGCSDGPTDSSWHGTQVAGLIAASTNNGVGMASVGRTVRVLPVRVLGKCGGYDSDIIAGMRWAAGLPVPGAPTNAYPARVINMSLGADGPCDASYVDAIREINAAGTVIVASAGNSAGHAVSSPANCPGVIAVAGLRHVGSKVGFSNIGPEVSISAPAGNCVNVDPGLPCLYPILTTSNTGTTTAADSTYTDSFNASLGTSFSAPLVSGTVALMLSVRPALTPGQVKFLLQTTARGFPTTGGSNGDGTPVVACIAPQVDGLGNPIDQLQCYCTKDTCGAGMLDAGAAVLAAQASAPTVPGEGTIVANPYGPLIVQGATLVANTLSDLQPNLVLQLGAVPGAPGSAAEIDFRGIQLGAGSTVTVVSGAPGQTIRLVNIDGTTALIAGVVQAVSGNGAPAPYVDLQSRSGIVVAQSGSVRSPVGLTLNALDGTLRAGGSIVNQGVADGGGVLRLQAANVSGGGAFAGDTMTIATFGNANNPAHGADFLANGLQLFPGNGNSVALTLNGYGGTPQVFNLMVNGNGSVTMPSAWPAGSTAPPNNRPVLPSEALPSGSPVRSYAGGSLIVQATGTLTLLGGESNDFVFPGGIVLKSGGVLDVHGVAVDNGWTTVGKSFQGVYFEAPDITSNPGNIQVFTNNLNWVNFSTFPHSPVRTWQLAPAGAAMQFQSADTIVPHLNTYSLLVEAAAAGQCWVCLVHSAPVNMR